MQAQRHFPLGGIHIRRGNGEPLYRQIYHALRRMILDARILPGQQLPTTRRIAEELGVSRNTILLAYDDLLSEGYIVGRVGAGTFVNDVLPDALLNTAGKTNQAGESIDAVPLQLSRRGSEMLENAVNVHGHPLNQVPFRHGMPDVVRFPYSIWNRYLGNAWSGLHRREFAYSDPRGYLPLRTEIAGYLRSARDVQCRADQIIIVDGTQQSLDICARAIIDEGDQIAVEDPGYLGARAAFLAAGAVLKAVPIDAEGPLIDAAGQNEEAPRLFYTTPSFQFPTGVTTSAARRFQLLAWAEKNQVCILEDDYDSEFRYSGHPLPSLQGLDRAGRVIYLGTFSKVLIPGFRLGYLVAPYHLVDGLCAARSLISRSSNILQQVALAGFIRDGHFGRHIRKMRRLYDLRRSHLLTELDRCLPADIERPACCAGMHMLLDLPAGYPDQEISKLAAKQGVMTAANSEYYLHCPPRNGLVLGFTAFDEDELSEGTRKLCKILQDF